MAQELFIGNIVRRGIYVYIVTNVVPQIDAVYIAPLDANEIDRMENEEMVFSSELTKIG